MNRNIILFLSRLPHDDLLKTSPHDILVQYWECAARQWNTTHNPVQSTIRDVEEAFRLLWPNIYGDINGSQLYLSFSYVDYLFTENLDGTISGGIFNRDGKKPSVRLNMTPIQIVELATVLRHVPAGKLLKKNLASYYKAEEYIEAYSRHEYRNVKCPMSELEALHQKAIHIEDKATALKEMGYYEEALEWFQKSILTKRTAGLEKDGHSFSDYAYTSMGWLYEKLLDNDLAETCYQYVYNACFKRLLNKQETDIEYASHRLKYWSYMYSSFLSKTGRPEEAKKIENLTKDYDNCHTDIFTLNIVDMEKEY